MQPVLKVMLGGAVLLFLLLGWLAWAAFGPSRITIRNSTGHAVSDVRLQLAETCVDIPKLAPGESRTHWHGGGWGAGFHRQDFIHFEATTTDGIVRGCAGEFLDFGTPMRSDVDLLPGRAFESRQDGEPYPQEVCAIDVAAPLPSASFVESRRVNAGR